MHRTVPFILAPLLALGACTTAPPPPPRAAAPAPAPSVPTAGLERVMGRDAAALLALFGAPALDVREGPARKLQFRGAACVLDAYLYPPASGAGPGRVTWIDARTPVGGTFDPASCIAALVRR